MTNKKGFISVFNLLLLVCVGIGGFFSPAKAQISGALTTMPVPNLLQYLQNYYGNTGTVSNLVVTCDVANNQLGLYNWGTQNGFLLTSGSIWAAQGPNSTSGMTGAIPPHPGDPNLNTLPGVVGTNDACVVEFDFTPACNKFGVSYFFGSEEYPEFVGSFNDVFAIFMTGPNPNGAAFNMTNIACIPPTATYVSINNINPTANPTYYTDNTSGMHNAQYDGFAGLPGFAQPLDTVLDVFPGQLYHIKIAIADDLDNALDSGVFFGTSPDSCTLDSMVVIVHDPVNGGDTLHEGCTMGEVLFQLYAPASQDVILNVSLSGSASMGSDFMSNIPPVVTIPAGQSSVSYPITTLPDTLIEGNETIVVYCEQITNCFGVTAIFPFSATLTIEDTPPVKINAVPTLCSGESVTLSTSSLPTYTQLLWSPATGLDNPTLPNPTLMIVNNGTSPQLYNYVLTATTPEGCAFSDTVLVTINPELQIDMPAVAPFCSNTSVVIGTNNVPTGTVFNWSPATGLNSNVLPSPTLTLNNTTTTPQTFTYIRNASIGNCLSIDTLNVTVYPRPVLSMPTPPVVCSGGSAVLGSVNIYPNTTLSWTPALGLDNPLAAMPTFSLQNNSTQQQFFTYIRLNDNGVCSESDTITVQLNPVPVANFQLPPNPTCEKSIDLQAISAAAGSQYVWNWGDGNVSNGQSSAHTYASPLTATIQLTVTDADNCTNSISKSYQTLAYPIANFTVSPDCEDKPISFINASTANGYNLTAYHWDFGTNGQSAAIHPTFTYPNAGTYNVTLAIQGQYPACADTISQTLTIYPNPTAAFTAQIACEDEVLAIQEGSISDANNPIVVYEWNWGDGSAVENGVATGHTYNTYGNYTVSLTTTTDKGCKDDVSKTVSVKPIPAMPIVENDTVCYGKPSILYAYTTTPSTTQVYWYEQATDTIPFLIGNALELKHNLDNVTYYVQAISENGCKSAIAPISVTMAANDNAYISPQMITVELPDALVNFEVTGNVMPPAGYTWNFGDGTEIYPTTTTPLNTISHAYKYPDKYEVHAKWTDKYGCMYDRMALVEVKEVYGVFVPSAFSPNGDNINDFLTIGAWQVAQFEFTLYNRWGEAVFFTNQVNSTWNGTDQKKQIPAPEGVYTYHLKVLYTNGKSESKGGTVTILR